MHRSVRAKMIVQSLRGSGRMTVDELSRLTGAPPVTIRRDLATLEAHGALRRVPGGAARAVRSGEELPYALRLGEDLERKTALAQAVCDLISDHETVIIDNGTTCHAVATPLVGRPLVCDLPEDAAIKAAAIESSERRVLVATADKLSRPSTFRFAAISELTHLMTTEDAPRSALEPFEDAGVEVTVVPSV